MIAHYADQVRALRDLGYPLDTLLGARTLHRDPDTNLVHAAGCVAARDRRGHLVDFDPCADVDTAPSACVRCLLDDPGLRHLNDVRRTIGRPAYAVAHAAECADDPAQLMAAVDAISRALEYALWDTGLSAEIPSDDVAVRATAAQAEQTLIDRIHATRATLAPGWRGGDTTRTRRVLFPVVDDVLDRHSDNGMPAVRAMARAALVTSHLEDMSVLPRHRLWLPAVLTCDPRGQDWWGHAVRLGYVEDLDDATEPVTDQQWRVFDTIYRRHTVRGHGALATARTVTA